MHWVLGICACTKKAVLLPHSQDQIKTAFLEKLNFIGRGPGAQITWKQACLMVDGGLPNSEVLCYGLHHLPKNKMSGKE